MNLIRFGKTYINFDWVTSVRDLSPANTEAGMTSGLIRFEFADGHNIEVSGDLQSILDWLITNSTSATTPEASP
ncbi:hypothetical protein BH23PLA1_BH23PLA1_11620 [soil metagenome]